MLVILFYIFFSNKMHSYIALIFLITITVLALLSLEEISKGNHHSKKAGDYTLGAGLIATAGFVSLMTTVLTRRKDNFATRRIVVGMSTLTILLSSIFAILAWTHLRNAEDSADNEKAKNYLISLFGIGFGFIFLLLAYFLYQNYGRRYLNKRRYRTEQREKEKLYSNDVLTNANNESATSFHSFGGSPGNNKSTGSVRNIFADYDNESALEPDNFGNPFDQVNETYDVRPITDSRQSIDTLPLD